jgi:hypothetical protein
VFSLPWHYRLPALPVAQAVRAAFLAHDPPHFFLQVVELNHLSGHPGSKPKPKYE